MKKTAEQITEGMELTGRSYLITGCNSGLGFESMRVLSMRGARVIGAARTLAKAEAACEKVGGDTLPLACELSDPASIRAAIASINEPLDAIIVNAGIMALVDLTLQHGIEAHLFTNHIGHFILVNGLLDRLTPNGRVVMVSSSAHNYARGKGIDLDDLAWGKRKYNPWLAYGQSKLANILYAKQLAKRLPKGQSANALHPGVIKTNLVRHMPKRSISRFGAGLISLSVEEGAANQIYVATDPSLSDVSGKYFDNLAIRQPSPMARDEALAVNLWDVTEDLVASL